jgi:NAD(P)-dependent dehydrogenase (short-subunit alcohol dehydrogenase family)
MISLENRTALITGSSRGIGRQIALGLARYKCNIILHGRTAGNLKETAELLDGSGVEVHRVAGDLSSEEGIRAVINAVNNQQLQVDILYNNAAIMSPWVPITETPLDEWHKTLQVNLYAVTALCNAFVPGMKDRKFGRVINLSSGIKDTPALAPYGVSKAAIDKFTQELAFDCKGSNVLVNYLDPGWLTTDLGGPDAMFGVETVLPGALVPALLEDDGPTGRLFSAQDFKYLG